LRRIAATIAVLLAACGGDDPRPETAALDPPVEIRSTPAERTAMPFRRGPDLEFRHDADRDGKRWLPETIGAGGGFFDHDGDGDLDLYLIAGGSLTEPSAVGGNRLLANDGSGTFSDVTATAGVGDRGYGMGMATGDIDNDGDVDLYVTNLGSNVLYKNRGDGTFEDVTTATATDDPRWSTAALFFDYDGDSDLDLFVVNYVAFDPDRVEPCRVLGVEVYCDPTEYAPAPDRLLRNDLAETGQLHFTDVTRAAGIVRFHNGLGAAAGDVDLDGDLDLYVANDRGPNSLWINRHGDDGPTFTDDATLLGCAYGEDGRPEAGMGVDLGDIDGDGDLDIVVTNMEAETNSLYLNEPGLGFIESSYAIGLGAASLPLVGWGVRLFDHDLDGDLDLVVANGHIWDNVGRVRQGVTFEQPVQLFTNDGGRLRTGPDVGAPLRVGRGLASADIDGDGDLDLIVTNNDGPPTVLLGTAPARPAVGLELNGDGSSSNRSAIGARVTVARAGTTHVHEIRRSGSYLSSHDPRLLLAPPPLPAEALSVVVRWPSGRNDRFALTPGAYHRIVEGAGVVATTPFRRR